MRVNSDPEQRSERLRVLIIAEACNPDWVSVPLVGWSHASALREIVDAHIVTHPRNREAILNKGLIEDRDFSVIDNEHVARRMHRLANLVRGGSGKGWTTVTALGWPSYWEFERLLWKRFGNDIAAGKYDLVHRITPLTPTMPSRLATKCKKVGVPFVIGPLNGGVPWPKGFSSRRRAEREWLSYIRNVYRLLPGHRSTVRDASAFVVGSQDTLELMDAPCRDRCVYVPENGIEPERFKQHRRRRASQPIRCVFLGRLVPYKGADLLIRAAADYLKRGEMTLRILGEGPQRGEIESLIREHGIGNSVEMLGWVEHNEVQNVLADSDFLGMPSIREFGGGVVLEAMALGLPGVVVGYGGPNELVTEQTGIRVPIGSPDEIVSGFNSAIGRLVEDPATIDRLGEAAKRRVDALFTWQAKANQTMEIYRWVLGHRDKPDFGTPFPDPPIAAEGAEFTPEIDAAERVEGVAG
ncbi:MAG: glycosyltransferase family 4 protein [Phycisphaeraceae bacterium]